MHDAVDMLTPAAREAYTNGDLADLAFADDTLLVGVSRDHLAEYLAAVAAAGQRYGLSLHYDKFQLLTVRCSENLTMPDGQHLEAKDEMAYLGTVLGQTGTIQMSSRDALVVLGVAFEPCVKSGVMQV